MRYLFIYIVFFFAVQNGYAQSGFVKRAQKQLDKAEYQKVEDFIDKSFEKDSLYPAAFYMKSVLLFTQDYPDYQIDSAYQNILITSQVYDSLDDKEKKQHSKLGVDLLSIDSLKRRIDNAAFKRAVERDKEEDYIFFLKNFATSYEVKMAIDLRNERAFENAVQVNTYQSYKNFMVKYPDAVQLAEAEKRYEKLYFDKSTADNKLRSYEGFLVAHPTTPYRNEAEARIFEVLTADHSVKGYMNFIKKYPKSLMTEKARNFMFHVAVEEGVFESVPQNYWSDSLTRANYDREEFMIPFLKNKRFGFINQFGNLVQDADYESIEESQVCGGIKSDYFIADNKLIGRHGAVIYDKSFDEVEDLGVGILKLKIGNKVGVIHKSGVQVFKAGYEDAKLIQKKFLALKRLGKWDLFSLGGVAITNHSFDNILNEGDFILFEKKGEFDIKKSDQLASVVDENKVTFKFIFDDYELLNDSVLWLQSSYGEVIYDAGLKELIPYDEHEISFTNTGFTTLKGDNWKSYDSLFHLEGQFEFDQFFENEQWIVYKKDTIWNLVDRKSLKTTVSSYDSLQLLGTYFALGYEGETLNIHTQDQIIKHNRSEGVFSLISSLQSAEYLYMTPENRRETPSIYDAFGNKIFQSKAEEITAVGFAGLTFVQKGKKGMVSASGEDILRPKYDAIVGLGDGQVSILKNKKFGLYDVKNKVLIPTEYERNIKRYNDQYYIAELEGRKILIDDKNEPLSEHSFEEVKFWNDTSAFVKNDFLWKLYDLKTGEVEEPGIKSFQMVKETIEEQVVIILIENSYGIWSNVRGEIIAPTFNDIINVGTQETPVYFTEKHIEEAEFYVVIYYDQNGKLIFKTATESEDYPMIYCDN